MSFDAVNTIQQEAERLFASGTLAEKTRQADELGRREGLNLFATALPWRIELPQGQIAGFSETFALAMGDIHAQLVTLARLYPPDTIIALAVDAGRLPQPRRSLPALSEPN
jgi:hypothetical protein